MAELLVYTDPPMSAARNMARDEVLLRSLNEARPAFLRWYGWEPFALSFGYFQRLDRDVDVDAAQAAGIDLVRRMTGGRMVFHADEITFSIGVTLAVAWRLAGESRFPPLFKWLLASFVTGLGDKGVPARFSEEREILPGRSDRVHCYSAAAGHSIYAGERKLIGAAGMIRGERLVIHGSIPLSRVELPPGILLRDGQNLPAVAYLDDFLPFSARADLRNSIERRLSDRLDLPVRPEELSMAESRAVELLADGKYVSLMWPKIPAAVWENPLVQVLPGVR